MVSPQYQTRLPKDTAEAIDQYAEEFDISESEVMRRAARRFVRQEGYIKEPATDGGGTVRHTTIRAVQRSFYIALLTLAISAGLKAGAAVGAIPTNPTAIGLMMVTTAILVPFGLFGIAFLQTGAPERLDRHAHRLEPLWHPA